ncbi:MAG: uroporphyrinogen decarboxylase family protein [Oscillospiraceae bacterium]|nr:uroporphyrinogen decarboxylase family protein [Oscillospiraceae bacterium]
MKALVKQIAENKNRPVPVLSFPSTQLLDISVKELIFSSEKQAEGMRAIVARCPVGASLNMMDLSVEAEAFGAPIKVSENEIPTVAAPIVAGEADIERLAVPEVGAGRTGIYLEGVRIAAGRIAAVPVFCGAIGPYSLAGRLMDMTELMMACFESPEAVSVLIEKCTRFIVSYIRAFRAAGAAGVVLAEPAAGLLSPDLCEAFSSRFVRRIVAETADEDFVFIYHNCGNTVPLAQSLIGVNADIYHFGNAVRMEDILPLFPCDKLVMGNLDPLLLRTASPSEIRERTASLLKRCARYDNYMISTGCDVPHSAKWENIDAFFDAVTAFYAQ